MFFFRHAVWLGDEMERRGGVIVVGAGPVGFLTALGLARQGIPVTLLEAEERINDSPRAAVYFPTTVRILARLGVLEDALAIGLKSWAFTFRVPSTGQVVSVDNRLTAPGDDESTYNLHFGQHILARIVMQHLERLPHAEIRWNARVVGLKQDAKSVTVTTESPDGSRAELQADWVIGTDGGRSSVRNLLGLPFEGHTWPDRFVATNLFYDFKKYGFGPANMVSDPVDWAVVAVLGKDDMWRVTYGEDASLPEEEARRRIPEHYAKILPGSEPYEIVASSPYRVHERCAPTFHVGRALLAGDAAHVCNPCGGLGLTTGVIDAMAVVDTLAAVIAGRADESVLDFYSQERRRVYLEVTSPLASNFKRMLSEKDPARRAQDVQTFQAMVDDPSRKGTTQNLVSLVLGKPMPV
jgi:2-polyprenyl-6-methoxyphenol hydroxylase-like FAD-dependent oxidoreductase